MPAVRLVNPSRLRRRRASRRSSARRGRRRNMPAGLRNYWAKVRRALSSTKKKGVKNPVAKHRRRRRSMPAGLRRYWASRRRSANPSRRRRRRNLFGRSRRRNYSRRRRYNRSRGRSRVVYMSAPRRRRRHNPLLSVSLGELVPLTAWAVGGMAGTRIIPQMVMPGSNTGLYGYGMNFVTAVGLSWLGGKFAGQRASQGLLVGGMVALASRILTDTLGTSGTFGGALAGDLDFDLGFYINNSFPLPTTGSGPFLLQPGVTGSPTASGGGAIALPPAAPGSASQAGGGVTAGQIAAGTTASEMGASSPAWRSPWAA